MNTNLAANVSLTPSSPPRGTAPGSQKSTRSIPKISPSSVNSRLTPDSLPTPCPAGCPPSALYTCGPLYITVVCHRNETNDKTGFKLVYESPTGFKTAGGWFTIPDNKTLHTVRFHIEAPLRELLVLHLFSIIQRQRLHPLQHKKRGSQEGEGGWKTTVIQIPSGREFDFELIQR